jgi:hypothetical protein
MKIDERVEGRLRVAYSAAIGKDADQISEALAGITKDETAKFIGLGIFVCGFIVKDVLREELDDDRLLALARDIVKDEADWMDLGDPAVVAAFLKAAATGDHQLAGLDGEDITGLAIVCGAHLLAHYRLGEQRWFQYLDEIWAALEAAPNPPEL